MPDTLARPVVLLVEDEVLVRLFNADALDEAGFRVIEAANADEARSVLEARPDVQVLVTDVDMPGSMNGFELAQWSAEKRPFMGILIISGRVRPKDRDLPDESLFLAKPYVADQLVRAAREVLEIRGDKRPSDEHKHSRSR